MSVPEVTLMDESARKSHLLLGEPDEDGTQRGAER